MLKNKRDFVKINKTRIMAMVTHRIGGGEKKEGSKEKSIEIAKKLIKMNIDLKQIKEIIGLSIEELENIKSNIDK